MKHLYWSVCLLGILAIEECSSWVRYNGDQVLQITPQTAEHAEYLKELAIKWTLDLWRPDMVEEISALRQVEVRIPFSYVEEIKENLLKQAIPYTVTINDVQKMIDQSTVSNRKGRKISLDSYDYTKYHPMSEIYNWMDEVKERHSDLISHHYLASTYENRPIYYFKIGYPYDKQKKSIVVDCGIHAREWIAVAFCQWLVREIINNHRTDAVLQNVLRQVDIYIIPVLNVDGYIYSWTDERLWRKNRTPQGNGTCYGVDLNRNFDAQWCKFNAHLEDENQAIPTSLFFICALRYSAIGASTNCSSNVFCGPEKASELESQGLIALINPLRPNVLSYLTIHSYGQYILLPHGYRKDESQHHQELMDVANKAAAKMLGLHGKHYTVGSTSVVLYDTSGNSADWAFDINIKFSYTYELRDNGTLGFLLPEDQIKDTCDENTLAVMAMLEHINDNYLESNAVTILSIWLNVIFSCAIGMYFTVSH